MQKIRNSKTSGSKPMVSALSGVFKSNSDGSHKKNTCMLLDQWFSTQNTPRRLRNAVLDDTSIVTPKKVQNPCLRRQRSQTSTFEPYLLLLLKGLSGLRIFFGNLSVKRRYKKWPHLIQILSTDYWIVNRRVAFKNREKTQLML